MLGLNFQLNFNLRTETREVQFYEYAEGGKELSPICHEHLVVICDGYSVAHQLLAVGHEVTVTATPLIRDLAAESSDFTITWQSEGPLPVGDFAGAEELIERVKECCAKLADGCYVDGTVPAAECFSLILWSHLNLIYQEFLSNAVVNICTCDVTIGVFLEVSVGKLGKQTIHTVWEMSEDLVLLPECAC